MQEELEDKVNEGKRKIMEKDEEISKFQNFKEYFFQNRKNSKFRREESTMMINYKKRTTMFLI